MALCRQHDAVEQPGGRASISLALVCRSVGGGGGEEQPEVLDGFREEEGLLFQLFFRFWRKSSVEVSKRVSFCCC